MFDSNYLNQCSTADIKSCDTASLVDLRDIQIDNDKPVAERVNDFIKQVRNPYLFKVGDITVKVSYGDGKPLSDAVAAVFKEV